MNTAPFWVGNERWEGVDVAWFVNARGDSGERMLFPAEFSFLGCRCTRPRRAQPFALRPLSAGLLRQPWQQGLIRSMLRLSEQEYVESKIDHRRPIRFGILRVGSSGHVDSVSHGRKAWTVRRAIARGLLAFLMRPFERHREHLLFGLGPFFGWIASRSYVAGWKA